MLMSLIQAVIIAAPIHDKFFDKYETDLSIYTYNLLATKLLDCLWRELGLWVTELRFLIVL